jgi:DNA polymerase alpha subunit A
MPFDWDKKIRTRKELQYFPSERQMIEAFINRVTMVDPDLLVAHNLCGGLFELLLSRIHYFKVSHWSRIGRMKKSTMPIRNLILQEVAMEVPNGFLDK